MFPGTTYSDAVFLAPRRRPAESPGPLARPCAACEACRMKLVVAVRGGIWLCREQRLRAFKDEARAVNGLSKVACALESRGCSIVEVNRGPVCLFT